MNKLTWGNLARVLAWCIGIYLMVIFGFVLAGFICGLFMYTQPQHPVTVVKYVNSAPSTAASGR